jgi:malonyl-CoA/methylmalonyl-CoA synthetase
MLQNNKDNIYLGTVGRPCGSIKVRIVDEINNQVQVVSEQDKDMFFDKAKADRNDIYGELQVAGPIVFKEYYNKKEQTENSFTDDGWFRTGMFK